MKRLSIFLVLSVSLLLLSGNAMAQKSYGLCVGLSKCGTPGADDIAAPQNDAVDLKKVLVKQGFKASAVTNQYATRSNILNRVRNIVAATRSSQDKIVLFFATHGSENGYLLTYGGEFIKYSELIDILSHSKTKHIYCFVMACYSGSLANALTSDPNWGDNAVKSGITFMVSSRPGETSKSISLPHWKNSFFGHALINGMRGQADADNNRKVTLMELFRYVYNDVTRRLDGSQEVNGETQHPQLIGPSSEHDTVIARW